MTAAALLHDLWQSGIQPRPAPDRRHLLLPAHQLTDQQRQCLTKYKAEVLELLADPMAQALMNAAMRCCDHWRDSPEARMQMRLDIWNTPKHLRAELLAHLQREYPQQASKPPKGTP